MTNAAPKGFKGFDPTGGLDGDDEPVVPIPPTAAPPTPASKPIDPHAQTMQTEAQRIALELAEEWRRIQGGEALPRPIGPPPAPAGHAPLPSRVEQRAVLGLAGEPSPSPTSVQAQGTATFSSDPAFDPTFDPKIKLPRPIVPDPAVHAAAIGILASPDAAPAVERREPRPVLSVDGREIVLPLEVVLADPSKNYGRVGVAWRLDDPEVVETADTIEVYGLKNPIGVRKLDPPVERDEPVTVTMPSRPGESSGERVLVTHYSHEIVDGFKRFAALQLLGRPTGRFTELDVTAEMALLHNGIENINRTELNEYQLANYFALLGRLTGWTPDEVAAAVQAPKPARVAELMLIMERLPRDLLEIFRCSPTYEVRCDLARVARIHRETEEETHQAMVDEWLRLQDLRRAAEERRQEKKKRDAVLDGTADGAGERASRSMNRAEIERLRTTMKRAAEWYDSMSGRWRPIEDGTREFCDAMLRRACNPKGKPVLR